MIIGLSGRFCSGKDLVAAILREDYGFVRVAFADKLKEICTDLFAMKTKDRGLLQAVGVAMRQIRPSVWVDYVVRNFPLEAENIVITDVRFKNEAELLRAEGAAIVRVYAEDKVRVDRHLKSYGYAPTAEQLSHVSEHDLDNYAFAGTIFNNTDRVELLKTEVANLVLRIKKEAESNARN